MLTLDETLQLQLLEKVDVSYTDKFRNKEEWTEEEKDEQQKVYARIHELNKKLASNYITNGLGSYQEIEMYIILSRFMIVIFSSSIILVTYNLFFEISSSTF